MFDAVAGRTPAMVGENLERLHEKPEEHGANIMLMDSHVEELERKKKPVGKRRP